MDPQMMAMEMGLFENISTNWKTDWTIHYQTRRSGYQGLWGQNGVLRVMRIPEDDRSFFRTSGIIDQGRKAYT